MLAEKTIIEINFRLRRNRMILKKLSPLGKIIVHKEILDALEYDFSVFTSIFITSKKEVYYWCYDYACMPLVRNDIYKVLIVSKGNYTGGFNPWTYVKSKT